MVQTANNGAGYLETAFKERLGLARQQRSEIAKEQGIMGRALKDLTRGDWKQQRQQQYAQVKHVARIGSGRGPSPRTMGMPTMRGSAKGRGQAPRLGKRGGKKKTEGQRRAEEARGPSVFSAGGVTQLAGRRRWTAAGGQVVDREANRSVFHKAQQVLDPYSPSRIFQEKKGGVGPYKISAFAPGAKGGRRGQKGTGFGGPAGRDSAKGKRTARKSQQRQLSRKARIEAYRKLIAPTHGKQAAIKVMREFDRRQDHMFGKDGSGGSLSPALLWADMERV